MKETESTDGANRQEAPAPTSRDRWNPKGAWLLVVILLASQIPLALAVYFVFGYSTITHPSFVPCYAAMTGMLLASVTYFYLRPASIAEYLRALGLPPTRPSRAPAFTFLGFASGCVVVYSLDPSYYCSPYVWFRYVGPMTVIWLLWPLVDEPIMRGYLYPAFRTRYPVWKAVSAIVVIALVGHSTNSFSSLPAFLSILAQNIVLCLLRERNATLYPCLFFYLGYHGVFAFNQTSFRF